MKGTMATELGGASHGHRSQPDDIEDVHEENHNRKRRKTKMEEHRNTQGREENI
jgi:hypothetical protein